MIRLTTLSDDGKNVRVKVEGRIVGELVCKEVERECAALLHQHKTVFLDFTDVSFIDRRGVERLRRLTGNHVRITGATMLVRALLGVRC